MRRHFNLLFCLSLSLGGLTGIANASDGAKATRASAAAGKSTTATKRVVKASKLYSARVTSKTPLLVGMVVDQSGSNRHPIAGGDVLTPKSHALANAVNENLEMMVMLTADGMTDGTDTAPPEPRFKPWFHVVGVGYSAGTRPLIGKEMGKVHSTTDLAKSAEWLDGNGHPVTGNSKPEDYVRMKWVNPVQEGATHMGEGLTEILPAFEKFTKEHPDAPAPIAMHFTDGKPEGGQIDPIKVAKQIKNLKTKDGNVLLFNVHVGEQGESFMFPNEKMIDSLPMAQQADARRLFEMSSPMPPHMIARARAEFPEYKIPEDARTMVYNANGAVLAKLLEMGTVQNLANGK